MIVFHKITADRWMVPDCGTLRQAAGESLPEGVAEGALVFNDGSGLGLHQIACQEPALLGRTLSIHIVVVPLPDCTTDLCLQHWGAREIAVISAEGGVVRASGALSLVTWRHPDGAIGIEATWVARHGSIVLGTHDRRSRYPGHGRDQYALRSACYAVMPVPGPEPRWSETVIDYYPIAPQPRWGYVRPPHPQVAAVLERGRAGYRQVLESLARAHPVLHGIAHDREAAAPGAPFWNNGWFSVLDAAALVGFILERRPQRYLEIGSGHSTMFARAAIRAGGLTTRLISIDPKPRGAIDALCDHVVRAPLETVGPEPFECLEAGDILFFDGSHRVFTNSDVTVFFLDVLPRVPPGVLIHLHDIFLPNDYPHSWNDRLYSEQYMLAAMLLCSDPPFRVVLPNHFVCTDPPLARQVREIFRAPPGQRDIPFLYPGDDFPGVSFWLERHGPCPSGAPTPDARASSTRPPPLESRDPGKTCLENPGMEKPGMEKPEAPC